MRQQAGTELPFVSLTENGPLTYVLIDATGLEPQSQYQLILESMDSFSVEQPMLRIDLIDILIGIKACDVLQENMDEFCATYPDYYQMFAQLGVTWEQVLYSDLYDTAYYEWFGLDDPDRESCGDLVTEFNSPYPFLVDFPSLQTLQLKPEWTDAEGIYTEAAQTFTLNGFSCSIPVTATVWDCDLVSVGFKQDSMNIEYEIGSGAFDKVLPEVVQKPDCGLVFNEYAITKTEASIDAALATTQLDKSVIKIQSSDYSLGSHTLRIYVSIVTPIITTEPLIVDIIFTKPVPEFNLDGLNVTPLTCSEDDANWVLELPPLTT